jgi:hypothetical protein
LSCCAGLGPWQFRGTTFDSGYRSILQSIGCHIRHISKVGCWRSRRRTAMTRCPIVATYQQTSVHWTGSGNRYPSICHSTTPAGCWPIPRTLAWGQGGQLVVVAMQVVTVFARRACQSVGTIAPLSANGADDFFFADLAPPPGHWSFCGGVVSAPSLYFTFTNICGGPRGTRCVLVIALPQCGQVPTCDLKYRLILAVRLSFNLRMAIKGQRRVRVLPK